MKIGILTFQNGFRREVSDNFYPLIKWKKIFRKEGIRFRFFSSHDDKQLMNQDVVIIDYRYYRTLSVHKNIYENYEFIIPCIEKLKEQGVKIILFDTGDGSEGRQWELINHVDILLKKQTLKNRRLYTNKKSFMLFEKAYKLDESTKAHNRIRRENYVPCPEDQLYKIRLGWNIGMSDYRQFPFSKYYPIRTSRLLNTVYPVPDFYENLSNRPIDSVFRGKINKDKVNYAFQRNKVIELFRMEKYPDYITGEFVPKKKYLEELKKSKTCVSPFGWGEVCYRDFEAIINGCLLIKPDMDHLETWPDVYRKNETYVSVKWDMSDMEETLNEVVTHYNDYKSLVQNAQRIYEEAITNGEVFVKRFRKLLE